MHIDDLSIRLQHDRKPLRIKPTDPNAKAGSVRGGAGMKDTAQTSALSRIASEALRQMQDEPPIRAEKVAQFKDFASDEAKFSADEAIDSIFARMFAL